MPKKEKKQQIDKAALLAAKNKSKNTKASDSANGRQQKKTLKLGNQLSIN